MKYKVYDKPLHAITRDIYPDWVDLIVCHHDDGKWLVAKYEHDPSRPLNNGFYQTSILGSFRLQDNAILFAKAKCDEYDDSPLKRLERTVLVFKALIECLDEDEYSKNLSSAKAKIYNDAVNELGG